jgi:hypothetical protein
MERVSPKFVLSRELTALLTSVAVEWKDLLLESRTLERHSTARKSDPAMPAAMMSAPISAARTRLDDGAVLAPGATPADPA